MSGAVVCDSSSVISSGMFLFSKRVLAHVHSVEEFRDFPEELIHRRRGRTG